MTRRAFIALLCGMMTASHFAARAQQAARVYSIGYLAGSNRTPQLDAFLQGMRDLGYVEGQNLAIEYQLAAGQLQRLPEMAANLVRLKVDIIVAGTSLAALPAKKATTTIPIVVLASHDGIGTGLFASLARPGGNITGIESLAPDIDAKRIEFLKGVLPKISRLALLYTPTDPGSERHVGNANDAARALSSSVSKVEVRTPDDFDVAFAALLRDRPDAVLVVTDALTFLARKRIIDFGTEHGIPMIFEFKEFVELGGLLSYGPSLGDIWRRGAHYVDKILKGAKPDDLPVEQPTKFELAINLRTANALGLAVPPTLLARADEVIE